MYKSPEKTYRDLIKEKNLSLNELGDTESQKVIRDALCDTAIDYKDEKYIIHDRCILDNIIHTLWLAERNKITDTNFIADSLKICRNVIQLYDVIFWLPLNPAIDLEENNRETRSVNPQYREEIDALFYGAFESYRHGSDLLFPLENSPCMIALEGDVMEKMELIENYLGDDGNLPETEHSVIEDINKLAEKMDILNQFRNME
jgi:hypothetical protein